MNNHIQLSQDEYGAMTEFIPRDPSLYEVTDHFKKRFTDPYRAVNQNNMSLCIQTGKLAPDENKAGRWEFSMPLEGMKIHVVGGIGEYLDPVLVTGYGEVIDEQKARSSPRWTEKQIHGANIMVGLMFDEPERIQRSIVENNPMYISGHRIQTDKGDPAVHCQNCGKEFTTKGKLSSVYCK